jgi:hypothetical protein
LIATAISVIEEKRKRERRKRERRGGEGAGGDNNNKDGGNGGPGGGGGGRTCWRRNFSGRWRWWTRRSRTKAGMMAATAGVLTAAAATGTGASLSSLHSLVMLSNRPPKLVRQVAPCGGGARCHQGGGESRDCAGGRDHALWGANL